MRGGAALRPHLPTPCSLSRASAGRDRLRGPAVRGACGGAGAPAPQAAALLFRGGLARHHRRRRLCNHDGRSLPWRWMRVSRLS
eukprot:3933163-Rhodomonas_salina.2